MVAGHYKADRESVFKSITMDKTVLSAQDLLEDSIELGLRILESGFEPTMIIAIWRGGTPVGIVVQETLAYCGIQSDHIAIRTSYRGAASYNEMVSKADAIRVHGLQYLLENRVVGPLFVATSKLTPYFLVSAVFAFLYWFMPNTRVRVIPAITGGLAGGFIWASMVVIFTTFVATASARQALAHLAATHQHAAPPGRAGGHRREARLEQELARGKGRQRLVGAQHLAGVAHLGELARRQHGLHQRRQVGRQAADAHGLDAILVYQARHLHAAILR